MVSCVFPIVTKSFPRLRLVSQKQTAARVSIRLRQARSFSELTSPDPSMVDSSRAPADFDRDTAVVYSGFIRPEESDALVDDLEKKLKRRRYEKGHWDAVIIKYKEIEVDENKLSDVSRGAIERIRYQLRHTHLKDRPDLEWLPCHAIDLHGEGELNAHVDSVRFSGAMVAGLSLLSGSIMRFRPDKGTDQPAEDGVGFVDIYLPPLSLYVMTGSTRFKYTHELLPHGAEFADQQVHRDRRISLIFRDAK